MKRTHLRRGSSSLKRSKPLRKVSEKQRLVHAKLRASRKVVMERCGHSRADGAIPIARELGISASVVCLIARGNYKSHLYERVTGIRR